MWKGHIKPMTPNSHDIFFFFSLKEDFFWEWGWSYKLTNSSICFHMKLFSSKKGQYTTSLCAFYGHRENFINSGKYISCMYTCLQLKSRKKFQDFFPYHILSWREGIGIRGTNETFWSYNLTNWTLNQTKKKNQSKTLGLYPYK